MQTIDIKALEKRGNDAVKRLRKTKHEKGLPFMINSKTLPPNQCYLEYPDGSIALVNIKSITDRDFTTVRILTDAEREEIINIFLFK